MTGTCVNGESEVLGAGTFKPVGSLPNTGSTNPIIVLGVIGLGIIGLGVGIDLIRNKNSKSGGNTPVAVQGAW